MPLEIVDRATKAYNDQKPGTSGLRKKVKVFQQPNYLANFVQATFNALRKVPGAVFPKCIVVGGDGRFYSPEACQIVVNVAAANGVDAFVIGQNTLLSTPAVSALVRSHPMKPQGAFILTASHNPGGEDEDFGIKYNAANGGPAPEKLTNVIHDETLAIASYKWVEGLPETDVAAKADTQTSHALADGRSLTMLVVDSVANYADLLASVFDFDAIRKLIARKDFSMTYDGMHGVAGPYAKRIFVDLLGADASCLMNCDPKSDFGKGHPDPNLTYAKELVAKMGLDATGAILPDVDSTPDFGAAGDGDADRNMILGGKFFVTPSDSVAIIAANAKQCIPFFREGVKAVARSMPTSGALDNVAKGLGVQLFEVPTGWKFFGNLMDSKELGHDTDFNPLICGEESFGTGSNHVREKDGIWAVLAWLSILAYRNSDASKPLVSVAEIVRAHWATYGRNFYCRYDYEGVTTEGADKMMNGMRAMQASDVAPFEGKALAICDDFRFVDAVDKSVSEKQGIRMVYTDGSRFVFRLSGTGSSGATIRLYMEKYMDKDAVAEHLAKGTMPTTAEALQELVGIALATSKLQECTGRDKPTVIT